MLIRSSKSRTCLKVSAPVLSSSAFLNCSLNHLTFKKRKEKKGLQCLNKTWLLFQALITSNIDFHGERSEQCRQVFWEWTATSSTCLRPEQLDCIHVHQIRLWSTFFCSMPSPTAFLNFLFFQFVDKNPFSIVEPPWFPSSQLRIHFKLIINEIYAQYRIVETR